MRVSDRRLLASIHDVGPMFETEVDRLVDLLSAHLGGPRFAMLVVPDHWNRAPLASNPGYQARLRSWADAGVEMFVHGWSHRDEVGHTRRLAAFRAKHMTAGEGEFLGLTHREALARMKRGRTLLEDVTGRAVTGFVAPAWLYGPGAVAALGEAGFAVAEDHFRVWSPTRGRTLARGPVITWASRSPMRIRSSLGFAAIARHSFALLDTVRVAVHPGDTHVPDLLDSITSTLAAAKRRHRVCGYKDLLAAR
jgi:predicted deacetylase